MDVLTLYEALPLAGCIVSKGGRILRAVPLVRGAGQVPPLA